MARRGIDVVATELSCGKAKEVYSALSTDDSAQHKVVKTAILRAYELVPEAYRQELQNTVKSDNQTHAEFARQMQTLFERWCTSKEINDNFEKLQQVILVEEFKNCVPHEVEMYLEEKRETLRKAAVLVDGYVLTHKGMFCQQT